MSNYVTPQQVCQFLALDANDADILADVTFMLDYVEYLVEGYMGTSYVPTSGHTARYFNGLGTNMITFPQVLSVLDKVELVDDDQAVISEYTGIILMPPNPKHGGYRWMQRRRGELFPVGEYNIKVTGTFGVATVPKGLPMACALTVQHCFNMRRHNEFVRYEMNGERQVYQISTKEISYIPQTAMQTLDDLRVYNIEFSE
jgi:hypothetical protein